MELESEESLLYVCQHTYWWEQQIQLIYEPFHSNNILILLFCCIKMLHASNDACYILLFVCFVSVFCYCNLCMCVCVWHKIQITIAKSQTTKHTHAMPTYLKIMLISLKANQTHSNTILIFIDSFFYCQPNICWAYLSCKYK